MTVGLAALLLCWSTYQSHMARVELRQLISSDNAYRAMLQVIPGGVITVDANSERITSVNPAMCKRLGYEWRELINQPAVSILPDGYRGKHEQYWRDLTVQTRRQNNPVVIKGAELIAKDGEKIKADLWVCGVGGSSYKWLVFSPPLGAQLENGVTITPKE